MGKRRIPIDTIGIKGARIWPKKSTLPVGYIFCSKFGRSWEIIENCGAGRYRIVSEGIQVVRSAKEIKNGQILHPYDRNVYSRGYLGVGEHTYNSNPKRSDCWRAMFKRCYEEHGNYPTYTQTTVCEEWHNFQNFAEWYDTNYQEGYDLDKDLKDVRGLKVYSEDTCCFLDPILNKQLSQFYNTIPTKEGKRYRAKISFEGKCVELGRFYCWENALCIQVRTKFSALEGKIRKIFGDNFIEKYWNNTRLFVIMNEGVNNVKSPL